MSVNQARVPGGVPSGGQFAAQISPEASTKLDAVEWSASDGTYAFPAVSKSARETVAFWSKVSVPEDVLRDVEHSYWSRNVTMFEEMREEYEKEYPDPRKFGGSDEEYQKWRQYLKLGYDKIMGERPEKIPPYMVRPLVRAAQMHWTAQETLPAEERDRLDKTTLEFPDGTSMTPREAVEFYEFDDIKDSFNDTGVSRRRRDEMMFELLDEIRQLRNEEHDSYNMP